MRKKKPIQSQIPMLAPRRKEFKTIEELGRDAEKYINQGERETAVKILTALDEYIIQLQTKLIKVIREPEKKIEVLTGDGDPQPTGILKHGEPPAPPPPPPARRIGDKD